MDVFAKNVFEVWDGLTAAGLLQPRYLQLVLLVAIHTFIKEEVDVVICETHNGGEYDATNVFPHPIATGITTIGMDHVLQLGPTVENIAWHKSGIFKPECPAFSTCQEPQAASVLKSRANEKNILLEFVNGDIGNDWGVPVTQIPVQRKNASLALKLANTFLSRKAPASDKMLTESQVRAGLENFAWNGRFQQIVQGNDRWYLDGAHNELSVPHAARWFAEVTNDSR